MITGHKIRLARQLKNIPAKEMADLLDIECCSYSRLERGDTKLTETRIEAILQILKVNRSFVEHIEGSENENEFQGYNQLYEQVHHLKQEIEKNRLLLDRLTILIIEKLL